eukprot:9791852-Ditylum_brightwellii.AAC.1
MRTKWDWPAKITWDLVYATSRVKLWQQKGQARLLKKMDFGSANYVLVAAVVDRRTGEPQHQ